MASAEEHLSDWLRDAHAMEEQSLIILKDQLPRLENFPILKDRVIQHVEETEFQAREIRRCLNILGENTSTIKDVGSKFTAKIQSMSGLFADDEMMKSVMANYTFECMEIVSYNILISAAQAADKPEVQDICEHILIQEMGMATWLDENISNITADFLISAKN